MSGVQIDGVNNKIDFDDDQDTSISSATDDTLVIESGGVNIASITAGEFAINEGSADIDFRIEGNGDANAFFLDGAVDRVYLGNNTNTSVHNLDARLQIVGTDFDKAAISITRFSNDANGPTLQFAKSRNATLGSHTIVQDGDELGKLKFGGSDGSDFDQTAAEISAFVDGSPSSGTDMPGGLAFKTTFDGSNTASEKMRIHNHGQVLVGNNLVAENSQKLHVSTTGTSPGFGCDSQVTSLGSSNTVMEVSCKTSATSAYRLFRGLSGNSSSTSFSDNEFIFNGSGGLAIDGSYTSGGADYAEMFEWKDGNSSSEDRRGYSVVLDGNQIVKATESDDASKIIGIVSALPVLIGDSDIDEKWKSKYLKDDFGNFILEEYTTTTWTEIYKDSNDEDQVKEHSYATDRIPSDVTVPSDAVVKSTHDDGTKITRKKLNPEWDSSQTYVRRQDRKEWDAIGLMGKLRLRKGQPTGTNWIKMRDISDTVEEWLVR